MLEFRVKLHSILPKREAIEVWENGVMVATVYPDDEARRIRIISKHELGVTYDRRSPNAVNVTIGKG